MLLLLAFAAVTVYVGANDSIVRVRGALQQFRT